MGDNIGMDFKEIGVIMRDWVNSAQYMNCCISLVNAALNLWVPSSWNCTVLIGWSLLHNALRPF